MSTTDQRPPEAPGQSARPADAGVWAVPGVDHAPSRSDAAHAPGEARPGGEDTREPSRERPEASTAAAARWRADLDAAARGAASGVGSVHPVIAALATCVDALDGTRDAGVGTLTAREVRMLVLAVAHLLTAAVALKLRLLVAGEAQRVADLTGATSTASFLSHLTRTDRPDAGSEVRLAKDLHSRYPLLADALALGTLNIQQLRVCVAALRKLPKDLPTEKLAACQRFLLDAAQSMGPRVLKVVGRRLWEVIDPDGAESKDGKDLQDEEERARAKAYFRSWRNGDGTTGFRGKLPDAQADMLLKLLHAHASPRRRANPNITTSQPDDVRSGDDTGHADSPADVAGSGAAGAGATGAVAGGGADPPDGDSPDRPGGGGCDGSPRDGCLDDDTAEEERTGKQIPYPVRLGHALIDLLERIPAPAVPDVGGTAATIVVTMREDQLRSGLGTATLDTGSVITAGQARRLACDAGLVPMVLDGDSQPLDLGREQRLFTKAQRLVVAHRQHGICGIDGCDRPITAYHHPHPWNAGGETNLANALGLCGYHHHLAHHPQWWLARSDERWFLERTCR